MLQTSKKNLTSKQNNATRSLILLRVLWSQSWFWPGQNQKFSYTVHSFCKIENKIIFEIFSLKTLNFKKN